MITGQCDRLVNRKEKGFGNTRGVDMLKGKETSLPRRGFSFVAKELEKQIVSFPGATSVRLNHDEFS
jgi:hypothetical protein